MSVVSKPISSSDSDENHDCIDWKLPLSFVHRRHLETIEGIKEIPHPWRMKERMKTVSVALVLCLNVGVDPPDIVKTQPCARLECWIDPSITVPTKAIETIGSNLQKQYEKWQPRARYKQSLDPTSEDVKKLCQSLRKNAKDERVLFHYNGHGVPMPTNNGEIWVFNKTYTQYIPLSVYDLQTYMGAPSIYVYDCSSAGTIIRSFKQFADQQEKDFEICSSQGRGTPGPAPSFKNCIQLGACAANQILPMNPDLPADLFTSCLTTPIKVALKWYCMQSSSKLVPKVTLDLIDKIPGQLNDRRTMLGELNWIFTAITDTIAWNTLSKDLFQKLFRQDLLVASLFRNFLLAERIMRSYDCTPVSSPQLPSTTYQHSMWQAWDMALDLCLSQLPAILAGEAVFEHSLFFEEQLTAFQVWLELGNKDRSPPEQLPIVLQVLLSQVHRLRALELLGRFLDLGPWAVNLALSVGIFPYVLKLLQSSARELRPLLVFIWAKILAVDNSCQSDLVKDNGHKYFLSVLQDPTMASEHRTLSAFVLACAVNKYLGGQKAGLQSSLISICLEQLGDPNPLLRQWVVICLARLWDNYDRAKWIGVRDVAHEKLYTLLTDPCPEVRAAAVYALGTFISSTLDRSEHATSLDQNVSTMLLNTVSQDMSPLVRQELVVALQWMVLQFQSSFISVAVSEEGRKDSPLSPSIVVVNEAMLSPQPSLKRMHSRDRIYKGSSGFISGDGIMSALEVLPSNYDRLKRVSSSSSISSLGGDTPGRTSSGYTNSLPNVPFGSIYMKLWHGMQALERDPHPVVKSMCHTVMERIRSQAREICLNRESEPRQSSTSLPPSPSSRASYLTESPPKSLTGSASELSRLVPRSAGPVTGKVRKVVPNTISEEADEAVSERKPLVSTMFVAWRSKNFAQPVMSGSDENDLESKSYYEREWRYLRNAALRKESVEDLGKIQKIEHQVFNARSPDQPKIVLFHPYETHLAVAARDCFGIWEWSSGSRLSYVANRGVKGTRITALQWVNAHDTTLLLTGSEDGSARLWSNYTARENKEPELRSSWQALPDITPFSRALNGMVGMVMSWDQQHQLLVAAGDTPKIRLWDAQKELKVCDMPTGTEASVTCVSTESISSWLVVAGCGDGSVRLFDTRLQPQDARVMTWREHTSWVVGAHLKAPTRGQNTVISGSVAGDVRFFDIRKQTSSSCCHTSQGMTAMAVHENSEIFCCGSVNQFISVYRTDGSTVNVIKYHEGFMGTRIGPVSCLSLHPYKSALAAGNVDCNLSIYTSDNRR